MYIYIYWCIFYFFCIYTLSCMHACMYACMDHACMYVCLCNVMYCTALYCTVWMYKLIINAYTYTYIYIIYIVKYMLSISLSTLGAPTLRATKDDPARNRFGLRVGPGQNLQRPRLHWFMAGKSPNSMEVTSGVWENPWKIIMFKTHGKS